MNPTNHRTSGPFRLGRYVSALVAFWTVAVGITLAWELVTERNQAQDVARAEARGACKRNEDFLLWYSALGGLYARVSKETQPSPALAGFPDRDVVMPSGEQLTVVDPIDMMRQMREISGDESTLHAQLTGPRRTRSENAPDEGEAAALALLQHGESEVSWVSPMRNQSYMRVMRPLVLKPDCLVCHPKQAGFVQEVYGGFSASVPMALVWPAERAAMTRRVLGYGSMWLLGLAGIGLGSRSLRRQIEERRQVELSLREREAQMLAAQQIQKSLLPAGPPLLPNFDIAGATYPAQFASGDYFDYLSMRDDTIGLAIADACGHSLGSALLMASTQAFLRSSADLHDDLGEILGRVNRCLLDVAEQYRFVTLLLARLNPRDRTLTYASAGHPTGFVFDRSGSVKARLGATAMPLAVEAQAVFPMGETVSLDVGDTVVLVTDGILEALSPAGEAFGTERLLDFVRTTAAGSSDALIGRLFQAVREFCQPQPLVDDVTAVVIRVEAAS